MNSFLLNEFPCSIVAINSQVLMLIPRWFTVRYRILSFFERRTSHFLSSSLWVLCFLARLVRNVIPAASVTCHHQLRSALWAEWEHKWFLIYVENVLSLLSHNAITIGKLQFLALLSGSPAHKQQESCMNWYHVRMDVGLMQWKRMPWINLGTLTNKHTHLHQIYGDSKSARTVCWKCGEVTQHVCYSSMTRSGHVSFDPTEHVIFANEMFVVNKFDWQNSMAAHRK